MINHPRCLPPKKAARCFLLLQMDPAGRWHVLTNKERKQLKPRVAWLGVYKTGHSAAWVSDCSCEIYGDCPRSLAFAKASSLGCQSTTLETINAQER
jgi:hypothetical protein